MRLLFLHLLFTFAKFFVSTSSIMDRLYEEIKHSMERKRSYMNDESRVNLDSILNYDSVNSVDNYDNYSVKTSDHKTNETSLLNATTRSIFKATMSKSNISRKLKGRSKDKDRVDNSTSGDLNSKFVLETSKSINSLLPSENIKNTTLLANENRTVYSNSSNGELTREVNEDFDTRPRRQKLMQQQLVPDLNNNNIERNFNQTSDSLITVSDQNSNFRSLNHPLASEISSTSIYNRTSFDNNNTSNKDIKNIAYRNSDLKNEKSAVSDEEISGSGNYQVKLHENLSIENNETNLNAFFNLDSNNFQNSANSVKIKRHSFSANRSKRSVKYRPRIKRIYPPQFQNSDQTLNDIDLSDVNYDSLNSFLQKEIDKFNGNEKERVNTAKHNLKTRLSLQKNKDLYSIDRNSNRIRKFRDVKKLRLSPTHVHSEHQQFHHKTRNPEPHVNTKVRYRTHQSRHDVNDNQHTDFDSRQNEDEDNEKDYEDTYNSDSESFHRGQFHHVKVKLHGPGKSPEEWAVQEEQEIAEMPEGLSADEQLLNAGAGFFQLDDSGGEIEITSSRASGTKVKVGGNHFGISRSPINLPSGNLSESHHSYVSEGVNEKDNNATFSSNKLVDLQDKPILNWGNSAVPGLEVRPIYQALHVSQQQKPGTIFLPRSKKKNARKNMTSLLLQEFQNQNIRLLKPIVDVKAIGQLPYDSSKITPSKISEARNDGLNGEKELAGSKLLRKYFNDSSAR